MTSSHPWRKFAKHSKKQLKATREKALARTVQEIKELETKITKEEKEEEKEEKQFPTNDKALKEREDKKKDWFDKLSSKEWFNKLTREDQLKLYNMEEDQAKALTTQLEDAELLRSNNNGFKHAKINKCEMSIKELGNG